MFLRCFLKIIFISTKILGNSNIVIIFGVCKNPCLSNILSFDVLKCFLYKKLLLQKTPTNKAYTTIREIIKNCNSYEKEIR